MTVVVDTGGIIALVDADDAHHHTIRAMYEADPRAWVLLWVILPEVDSLLARHVGAGAAAAFRHDLAVGAFRVEWGTDADLARAHALCAQYDALTLGLVLRDGDRGGRTPLCPRYRDGGPARFRRRQLAARHATAAA